MSNLVKVESLIEKNKELVWECWTNPKHIVKWYFATDDWHTPSANHNFIEGGSFSFRMESKDGSMGFDYAGTYTTINEYEQIEYVLEDGRKVKISFVGIDQHVLVSEQFEVERTNSIDMQEKGWQNILTNFKRYVESIVSE